VDIFLENDSSRVGCMRHNVCFAYDWLGLVTNIFLKFFCAPGTFQYYLFVLIFHVKSRIIQADPVEYMVHSEFKKGRLHYIIKDTERNNY
jgi:hypothetical protein